MKIIFAIFFVLLFGLQAQAGSISYFESSPFGILEWAEGSGLDKWGDEFTGKQSEHGRRLYYFNARWYDSGDGRFISKDPAPPELSSPLDFNPYLYARNNPLRYVDPDGKKLQKVTLKRLDTVTLARPEIEFLLDDKISDRVVSAVIIAYHTYKDISPKFSVNNTFRTVRSQDLNTNYTKAKGPSRHQGGFGIDFNGVRALNKGQRLHLDKIMSKAGAFPMKYNRMEDPGHYSIDPKAHGYSDLGAAISENLGDWGANFKDLELHQYD